MKRFVIVLGLVSILLLIGCVSLTVTKEIEVKTPPQPIQEPKEKKQQPTQPNSILGVTEIPVTKTKYDLGDYPDFLIKNGVFDGTLVVGDKAPSADVWSISDIAVSLLYPNGEKGHPVTVGGTKLASEVDNIKNKNAILVGSPCINKAIADLFPNFDPSKCIDDYTYSGIPKNKGVILVVENNGKIQIIVTGYSQSNINFASNVLSGYKEYNLDRNLITINENGKIDNLKETVKKEDKTQEPEEKVNEYSMNQDIEVDYLTYEVIKVETFTKMGNSIFKKETDGKFVKVYLKITNYAKETKQIFTPRFKIIDAQDRHFDRVSGDILYISDGLNIGKQLQPSLTVSGAIVFELPKDSNELKIEIGGDWASVTKVIVVLSNIENIGTDSTLKEKQDEMMDGVIEEAEKKTEELLNQCNTPFTCASSCPDYMDVGQKNCPSGQLCCMQS